MLELLLEFIAEMIDEFPELISEMPGLFIVPALLLVSVVTLGELMLCRGKNAKKLYSRQIEKYLSVALTVLIAECIFTEYGACSFSSSVYLAAVAMVTIVLFLPAAVIINLILSAQRYASAVTSGSDWYRRLSGNVLMLWAVILPACSAAALYVLMDIYVI